MRRLTTILAVALFAVTAAAQTLNVSVGNVTYQFPASQAGDMTYADGTSLTIMGKTFTISDITALTIDMTSVADNTVSVSYNDTEAQVLVAGNVAQYITAEVQGAHVKVVQDNSFAGTGDDAEEIEYNLSGSSTDGEFYMSGKYKATVNLNGLTLTNATPVFSGAAINIANGKRIDISVKKDKVNTLTDCANPSEDLAQKACLYVKGHAEFKGKGVLNVIGRYAHAIKSGEYMEMKNCTINVTAAVKDGVSCNQYFLMESGELNISGTQDDGIQCDLDGDTSTGQLDDHEDEDSGNIYIEGGTLNVSVTAAAAKAIKSEGDFLISGGTFTCSTSGGGVWDTEKLKTKASACLSADGNMTISAGTLVLTSTGAGGKGIGVDGALTIGGSADITVSTSGNAVVASTSGNLSVVTNSHSLDSYPSSRKSSPKGIKVDGTLTINGGKVSVQTTGAGGEGIESKEEIIINDGQVTVNAIDDAINAAYLKNDNDQWVSGSGDMTINGGYVFAKSSGNDGIDANGNCYIKGGVVYAIGATSPEVAIDANTEQQKKLYITGGTIIAVGDLERGASITGGTCKYTTSWNENTWYALYNGSDLVAAFQTPTKPTGGGGPGGPGGPGGGGSNMKLVVYTSSNPVVKSGCNISEGTEYWGGMAKFGATVSGGTSLSLTNYSSSGGGGGWW